MKVLCVSVETILEFSFVNDSERFYAIELSSPLSESGSSRLL